MTDVNLNEDEQVASDAILAAMKAIRNLGNLDTPYNYIEEVIPAIHKLQMFVLMHWAHRIHPGYWSDWFHEEGPPPWIPSEANLLEQSANKVTAS